MKKQYKCPVCGWTPAADEPNNEWEHCPNCLSSIHVEDEMGFECGGVLEPVSIWVKPLAFPPFPLERIEELTKIMGGCGDVVDILARMPLHAKNADGLSFREEREADTETIVQTAYTAFI